MLGTIRIGGTSINCSRNSENKAFWPGKRMRAKAYPARLTVTHWTIRMPPQTITVFRYHNGKWPDDQASAKLARPNGPEGSRDARSAAPAPASRMLATAIQAKGMTQSRAAAPASSRARAGASRLIVDAAFQAAQ